MTNDVPGNNPDPIPSEQLPETALNQLDPDEVAVFILTGTTFERSLREGDEAPVRKVAAPGRHVQTVVTDRRLILLVERSDSTEAEPITYDQFSAVDERAQVSNATLRIRTLDRDYLIDVSGTDDAAREEAVEYLRANVAPTTPSSTGDDPLDRLERLAALYDDGALSEAEFTEKKRELLDRI